MVVVNDKYRVEHTGESWDVVTRKKTGEDAKHPYREVRTYHGTLAQALMRVRDNMLKDAVGGEQVTLEMLERLVSGLSKEVAGVDIHSKR